MKLIKIAIFLFSLLSVCSLQSQGSAQYPFVFPTDTSVMLVTSAGNFGGWLLKSSLGGGGGTSYFSRTSSVIYPSTITDRLGLGINTTESADVFLQVKGLTNTNLKQAVFENNVGTDILSVWNSGRIGINVTNALYNLHLRGNASFESSASDYTFINGSTYQIYGTGPIFNFQSTSVNTGGTGYTQFNTQFNGTEYVLQPHTGTAGKNCAISYRRKSGVLVFGIDTDRNFVRFGNSVYQGASIDFNAATRGFWWPRTHVDSLNTGSGYGGNSIYDVNNHRFLGVINNTTHRFITAPNTISPSTNDVLTWNGSNWVNQTPSSGTTNLTFSGSSSPIALNSSSGTDVNIIAGTGISIAGTSTDLTINMTYNMREESFTATGGQTAFTIAYSAPVVSGTSIPVRVYRNGIRLFWVASGPTITQFTYSGTTVTTASNTAGDIITIEYLN